MVASPSLDTDGMGDRPNLAPPKNRCERRMFLFLTTIGPDSVLFLRFARRRVYVAGTPKISIKSSRLPLLLDGISKAHGRGKESRRVIGTGL
jgi:hypothetical protein